MQASRRISTAEHSTTAQIIAQRGRSTGGAFNSKGATGDRLNAMIDQFEEFYAELEVGVDAEYGKEENRLQSVEDSILRLQQALATEQHRRVESFKTVEAHLQERCDTTSSIFHRQLASLAPDVPDRVRSWQQRLTSLELFIEEERILRQRAIEREREKLKKTVADFEAQLEIEKERASRYCFTLRSVVAWCQHKKGRQMGC